MFSLGHFTPHDYDAAVGDDGDDAKPTDRRPSANRTWVFRGMSRLPGNAAGRLPFLIIHMKDG